MIMLRSTHDKIANEYFDEMSELKKELIEAQEKVKQFEFIEVLVRGDENEIVKEAIEIMERNENLERIHKIYHGGSRAGLLQLSQSQQQSALYGYFNY